MEKYVECYIGVVDVLRDYDVVMRKVVKVAWFLGVSIIATNCSSLDEYDRLVG
jgi:hypothetical protein